MPSPGRRWLPVALAMGAAAWGGNQFTPLLVMYRQEQGFSDSAVYLLLASYVVGIVPVVLVAGELSNRIGRRAVAAPAPVVAMAASAVLALGASSIPLLMLGRVLSGIAVGTAMAVGTLWLKELSGPPWEPGADRGAAARRASVALTGGFLLGAGVAGTVAQWAPWPTVSPYVVHLVLTVPIAMAVRRAPETRDGVPAPAGRRPRIPSSRPGRRFLRLVVPTAPWVFGAGGVAYAVLPNLVAASVGDLRIAFSALATVVTLGCGVLAQPMARRLGPTTGLSVAMGLATGGMALAAVAAHRASPGLALVAAVVLGASYGTNLLSALVDVHATTSPTQLAGTVATFYALSYVGFWAPTVMAMVTPRWSYPTMLGAGAVVAAVTTIWLVLSVRRSSEAPDAPRDAAAAPR